MGKVVSAVASVAEIAIGVVTANPALIAMGTIGLAVTAISALAPTNTTTQNRLSKSVDVNAYRKIAFGNTVFGADIRYWEVHGNTGYTEVIAAAGHKCNSIGNLYVFSKLVNFDHTGDGVVGLCTGTSNYSTQNDGSLLTENDNTYKGDWRRTWFSAGSRTNAVTLYGGSTLWNSSKGCFMTGISYYINDYTYTQSNYPQGIPQQGTQCGEGALVYDPRRDPTYGGVGTHNINDQTTWTYSDLDSNGVPIGRNNALQMLFYLLGWRVADPDDASQITLTVGQGVNPADINIASFIAAANNCEIEQWYSDGLLSTGDSHTTNRQIIAAAAGGDISDPGGLWTYNVAGDDTANIAVTLNDDDVVSAVNYNPATSINTKYNQVGGSYIEPAPPILYQPQPYALISDPNYIAQDQGQKLRKNIDYQMVQNSAQAQKLARIWLNKNRLTTTFKATFTLKALQALYYNCVRLNYAPLGITNGLFRVTAQAINPMGGIDLTLTIENATAYGGGTIIPAPPPSAGVGYNAFAPVDMSGFGAEPTVNTGNANSAVDAVVAYWTPPPSNVSYAEVQYSLLTDQVNWTPAGRVLPTDNINATTNQQSINIGALQPQTQYAVRGRFVTISGVPGDWSLAQVLTGSGTIIVAFDTSHIAGTPTADIVADITANAGNIANEVLRGASARAYTDAMTNLNGEWIGTVVQQNQEQSTANNTALVDTLSLLGIKSGDSSSFIINADTLVIGTGGGALTPLAGLVTTTASTLNTLNTNYNALTGSGGPITALTTQYNSLQQTVGNNSVTINNVQQAVNGLVGMDYLTIDVNGHIGGFAVYDSSTVSDFFIVANVFGIIDPDTLQSYFSLAGGVARLASVEVDTLAVDSVTNATIAAFAVTNAAEYDDTSTQALGANGSAPVQVCALNYTSEGHPMRMEANVGLSNASTDYDANVVMTLYDTPPGGSATLIKTFYGRVMSNTASLKDGPGGTSGANQEISTFFRYATGNALEAGEHQFTLFAQMLAGAGSSVTKYVGTIGLTEFRDQTS